MDDYSLKRLIAGDFRLLIYYSEGDNPEPEIINSIEQMCTKHKLSPDSIRFAIGNYKLKNTKFCVFFLTVNCTIDTYKY